jgi:3-deoxy-D-manno-octulosonic-acid transferase
MAPALGRIDLFCMQSREDAERIRLLGAPAERIQVTGNIKWDFSGPELPAGELRREFGLPEGVPVLIAGSTSEGEEEVVLEAWSEVRSEVPDLLLVLAPRHPHRFEEVARLLGARGISFTRRSGRPRNASPLLLLDTLGELRKVYAAGTLCFVGGSLVPRGGQNLMEPAAAGRPVLFGPRTENFEEAARLLLKTGGGYRVTDGASLASTVSRLLRDPATRERAGEKARDLVTRNRGAASRTAAMIGDVLRRRKT